MKKTQRNNSIRKFLSTMLVFVMNLAANGQDIHFSQFYEAPLARNPALAGIFTGDLRIQGLHRDQWNTINVPFKTSLISLEYKMPVGIGNDFITTGSNAYQDKAGQNMLITSSFIQSLTYHKSLDDNIDRYISIGFGGGFTSRRLNSSSMTFDNQFGTNGYNPLNPSGETLKYFKRNTIELSTGISYNSAVGEKGNLFLGASVWHLLNDHSNFLVDSVKKNKKWQFNAGIKTFIAERIILHVECNAFVQGVSSTWMAGAVLSYYSLGMSNQGGSLPLMFGAGAFIRLKDAIVPVVKAGYKNMYISFSVDLVTSKLTGASRARGGTEIALSYIGFRRNSSISDRQIRCPRF